MQIRFVSIPNSLALGKNDHKRRCLTSIDIKYHFYKEGLYSFYTYGNVKKAFRAANKAAEKPNLV